MAFVVGIIVLAGMGGRAEAGDRELARQRYMTGTILYQRGRFADALVELERGKQADPRPEFDYNLGLCFEKLGRAAEAADAYERFLAARPQDREAQALRASVARLRQQAVQSVRRQRRQRPRRRHRRRRLRRRRQRSEAIAPPPASLSSPQPYGAPTSAEPAFDAAPRPVSFVRSSRGKATLAVAASAPPRS